MTKEQWQAVKGRDASYDGKLFCAYASGKTVCRPSCTLHTRTPQNTVIFTALEDAIARGYHPCPHCRPDLSDWKGAKHALVEAAKAQIEAHSREKFSLTALSGALYVNGSYLLRTFKEATGCTLLWYHNHVRCEQAKQLLVGNEYTISEIGEAVGFTSSSHFSHVFRKMTGLTPSEYRSEYYKTLEE